MSSTTGKRRHLIERFAELGNAIREDESWMIETLSQISPYVTARDEIAKSVRALCTYDQELEGLDGRVPSGDVAVALPFNNPLYSLVLYCFGAMLGGSRVFVRPSRITASTVGHIMERYRQEFENLPLELSDASGADFLANAAADPTIRTLIFTGAYSNLTRVADQFPAEKTLIYCGSGINPFIVGSSQATTEPELDRLAELIIASRIYNSGQDCLCTERIYVHQAVWASLIDRLIARLTSVVVGEFGDPAAEIVPLMSDLADRCEALVYQTGNLHQILPFTRRGNLVHPCLIEVPLGHPLLMSEKLAPVFVLARFHETTDLTAELDADYRFGATVVGGFESPILNKYPHLTIGQSVLEQEAENAHVPFGGCGKSGFVRRPCGTKDGPILYSKETTVPYHD